MRRPLLLSRQDGGFPCGRAATCCDRVLPPAALAPGEGSVLRDWTFPAISPPRRFCFAIDRLQSVAVPWVRAPCAPQRKGIGLANGRALRTNRALPQWLVKGLLFDHPFHIPWLAKGKPFGQSFLIHCPVKDLEKGNPARLRLFSTFFHVPLARSSRFCYTCNRQRWAGPSKGARVTPIPLWIERKNE